MYTIVRGEVGLFYNQKKNSMAKYLIKRSVKMLVTMQHVAEFEHPQKYDDTKLKIERDTLNVTNEY